MSFLGKVAYQLWYRPQAIVRDSTRRGGPVAQYRVRAGKKGMQGAIPRLSVPIPTHTAANATKALTVHILTGKAFTYQTVFCLHSLVTNGCARVSPHIYDDGSLTAEAVDEMLRIFPQAVLHKHDVLVAQLHQHLPRERFPTLHERWENYPHIRKIVDIHLGQQGRRLVMDSDLLFWKPPNQLFGWNESGEGPLHSIDCVQSYGYPVSAMEKLAGATIPPLVNVGVAGLHSDQIEWEFLEFSASQLMAQYGTSYYLEQALFAMLVARSSVPSSIAPGSDYITGPSLAETQQPQAVMHHYVDLSRDFYHTLAWHNYLDRSQIETTAR